MADPKCPIVVVCSESSKSSHEVINNIRKTPIEETTVDLGNNITGFKYRNVTKYYENDIIFISQNSQPLSLLPGDIVGRLEGCIVYFDANNRNFLHSLKTYADFMEENDIEFGILLCSELSDNAADGIVYKEAKAHSNVLDVIELDRKRPDGDDDESINHHDPIGYDELLQAIRAVIWSNVDLKRKANGTVLRHVPNGAEGGTDGEDGTSASSSAPKAAGEIDNTNLEAEMDAFEQLLTQVMMFKDVTADWSRSEQLAYAETFANVFDNLLCGDDDGGADSDNNE